MTLDLTRRLLSSGAVVARDVEAALYLSVVRGVSLARALVDRGVLSERALEEELSRRAGLPLRQVGPDPDIASKLPSGMCRMLAAVPLRADSSGIIEVAAVDPLDTHVSSEFSFHLGVPVRLQRATMSAIEEAIRRLELAEGSSAARPRRRTPAFPHGAPDTVPPSPPPPAEDVPIPLVKRLSAPQLPELEGQGPSYDFADQDRALFAEHEAGEVEERPPASRRNVLREPLEPAPAVSFPSSPPPSLIDGEPEPPTTRQPPRVATPPAASLSDLAAEHVAGAAEEIEPPAEEEPRAAPPRFPPQPPGGEIAAQSPSGANGSAASGVAPAGGQLATRAPDAGWAPSLPELLTLVRRGRSRDEVLDLVLRALTLVANRAAIFVLRKDHYQGWACNPAFGSEEELRDVNVSAAVPSVLATASAAGHYLGPIPQTPGHLALLAVMRRSTSDVAVFVTRVRTRPALLLVADELDDPLRGTRAMSEIAQAAGEALTRLVSGRP